jgi:pyruvate formate lyase activating enzyme
MHYQKLDELKVRCLICPHVCVMGVGEKGLCRGRQNLNGTLYAVNYGRCPGAALDPIEKKPLYHFRPGSRIVSLGPNSCNLSCFFCQNYDSSQEECPTSYLAPEELDSIIRNNCPSGYRQVAFTYTEPLTWYEYILDFARLSPDTDIVLVSNGFINPEPLAELLSWVKAMNIDLKSIRDSFYREHCGAWLEPVKQTIRMAFEQGVHVEVTNLLIPGLNDSDMEISELADFIASMGKDIPLHFSAYHPAYKCNLPATPPTTVIRACEIASRKLSYVYAGNIFTGKFRTTLCPGCGATVISDNRQIKALKAGGHCASCGRAIYGMYG